MTRHAITRFFFELGVAFACGSVCQAGEADFRWEKIPNESLSLVGTRGVVWCFHFAPDQSKPYFDPVSLISGESLTWNQPPDHAWHHALWFSWHTIDGVNYWEHLPTSGKPAGRTSWATPAISTRETGAARIELGLKYSPPDAAPVLYETRVIDVSAPDENGEYHFDWDSTFRPATKDVVLDRVPIPPAPDGKSWGGYAGLSIRFSQSLIDRQIVTDRGEAEFDQAGVHRSRGKACDYHGTVNGRAAGIAVLTHSANPRSPTPWYAIRTEMSYLNPAFLEAAPYLIRQGETLRLRYRIVVHAGPWDAERLKLELDKFHAPP